MTKDFSKLCRSILLSLLVLIAAQTAIFAQKKSEIVSGEYETLVLAVDGQGELTGYFDEGTGDDGKGNPRFTCSFFVYGARQTDGVYKIKTWFPGYADEVIDGELKFSEKDGKKLVNLHLNGEHGGCWNVAPVIKEAGGVDYELTRAEKWTGVRVVRAAKSFFYAAADAKKPLKTFVVKNDFVRILQTKGDAAEVVYTNANGKRTRGWIKTKDFYSIAPPSVKI